MNLPGITEIFVSGINHVAGQVWRGKKMRLLLKKKPTNFGNIHGRGAETPNYRNMCGYGTVYIVLRDGFGAITIDVFF